MEYKRVYNDPVDENDIVNKRYVDKSLKTDIDYADIKNKPELFSGSYDDLSDKPTIPDVNNLGSIVVDDISCKNLVNEIVTGYTLTGSGGIKVEATQFVTGFMEVEGGKTYTSQGFKGYNGLENNYKDWYTADKTFISNTNDKTATAPANAKFCRMNGVISTSSDMQLELGSTATNYSKYKGIGYTSGRNDNGSWVKYDDGRMELWGEVTMLANNENVVINFPFSFNSPNDYSIFATPGYNYHNDVICTWADKGWSSCRIFAVRSDRSIIGYDQNIDFQIKGYWK